jgi:hypothetical protein
LVLVRSYIQSPVSEREKEGGREGKRGKEEGAGRDYLCALFHVCGSKDFHGNKNLWPQLLLR